MASCRILQRCINNIFLRRTLSYAASGNARVIGVSSVKDLQPHGRCIRSAKRQFFTTSLCKSQKKLTSFDVEDENDFRERVLNSKTPMVVDFHAEWCGPCKMLGPNLQKEVEVQDGKITLAKVDIDELSDIAMEYNIKAVPPVIGIRSGQEKDRFEGNISKQDIKGFLEQLLQKTE